MSGPRSRHGDADAHLAGGTRVAVRHERGAQLVTHEDMLDRVLPPQRVVKPPVQRARDAKCSALVLTLDLQILGQRHKDLKNGMSVPPRLTLANILDLATKPAWALRALSGRKTFGNLVGVVNFGIGKTKSDATTHRIFFWHSGHDFPLLC